MLFLGMDGINDICRYNGHCHCNHNSNPMDRRFTTDLQSRRRIWFDNPSLKDYFTYLGGAEWSIEFFQHDSHKLDDNNENDEEKVMHSKSSTFIIHV